MEMEQCLHATGQVVTSQQISTTSSHDANRLQYYTFIKTNPDDVEIKQYLKETGLVGSGVQTSLPSNSSHQVNNLSDLTGIKPDPEDMEMEQHLKETDRFLSNQQIPLPSVSNHKANRLNDYTFIKTDPDDLELKQRLKESDLGVSDQQISLSPAASHEADNLSDLTNIKPDPEYIVHNVNKTIQDVLNQQISLPSPLKCEVKEEMMYCQFCSYCDVDFGRLKCHTFTQHSTEAAVVNFGESDHDIKFFCVKETCNFSTTMCTVYEEHLMNCCPLHLTLSAKEKERLNSTFHFVVAFHNKHCLSDITGFLENFSVFNKTYKTENDYGQFKKNIEDNDLFPVVSRSPSLSIVQSSMVSNSDLERRNLKEPFSSDQNLVPVFLLQNQNANLIENQTNILENISLPVKNQDNGNEQLLIFGPSEIKISKSKIHKHRKTKPEKDPFSCVECDECFQDHSDLLNIDMNIHSGEKPFICTVCDKDFVTSGVLNRHKRIHTGEKLFQCNVCKKEFTRSSNLVVHKRTHSGEKPFKCNLCGKDVTDSRSLMRHKKTHTGEKPFKCNVCDKGFAESSNLIRHEKTHTGQKPFRCELCDREFTRNSDLIVHKRIHTGEKPYNCNMCDREFTSSSRLIAHKRTHTGERPFKCNICDKKFTRNTDLIVHTRTHTGERPFKCDVCTKEFTKSGNLVVHKRTHTGEKPFKCKMCNKEFTRYSNLIVHENNTHKNKTI